MALVRTPAGPRCASSVTREARAARQAQIKASPVDFEVTPLARAHSSLNKLTHCKNVSSVSLKRDEWWKPCQISAPTLHRYFWFPFLITEGLSYSSPLRHLVSSPTLTLLSPDCSPSSRGCCGGSGCSAPRYPPNPSRRHPAR